MLILELIVALLAVSFLTSSVGRFLVGAAAFTWLVYQVTGVNLLPWYGGAIDGVFHLVGWMPPS